MPPCGLPSPSSTPFMAHYRRQGSLELEENKPLLLEHSETQREGQKPTFFLLKFGKFFELRASALVSTIDDYVVQTRPYHVYVHQGAPFIVCITVYAIWQFFKLYYGIAHVPAKSSPFPHLGSHCADVPPISSSEFYARQTRLAQALADLNASAYVAEPGANAAYFGNITSSSWHLSERPLLLIITADLSDPHAVKPKVSILTPAFEATRAKLLAVPAAHDITYASWPEDADPYAIAASVIPHNGTVFVDAAVRHFIVDGLQSTGASVRSAPVEVRRIRERKTDAELAIMKCVNEVTLLAIRAVREKMYIGMHESEAQRMIGSLLSAAGLSNAGGLVLFGGAELVVCL